ncbi:MAG: Gldg family protein [Gammaproteobacteria bacterium]|nr:Gldg family protein [Gammaproteobacteria bacterium]
MTRSQVTYSLLVALALFIGINIIANETLTSQRLDLTSGRLYTLSSGSRNILAKLDEPVTLRLYFSAKQFAGVPQYQNYGKRVRDLLEEYAAKSNGKLKLMVIEPEPFSEAEDQAVGYGIEQLPISASGEVGYLGLVGTNATDQELPIPYLNPEREDALEYEVTKLIYNLANPKKRVVGVLSSLPVLGGAPDSRTGRPGHAWASFDMLKEFFELKPLDQHLTKIDDNIDTLLVVHPKNLPRETLYAIDQFVLKGGKAMIFVDPLAEEDHPDADQANPMAMPKTDSNLKELFDKWGVTLLPDQIAGDLEAAVRVSFGGPRGPQEVNYLPWLQLQGSRLNHDDFITNQLKGINVGSAGVLEPIKGAKTTLTPLLTTGPHSGLLGRDAVMFVRDPNALLTNFKADKSALILAARITGPVDSAFPDGQPLDEKNKSAPGNPAHLKTSKGAIHVIVVADTDILANRFWVRIERMLGMEVPNPFANNADFLINAVDNLGGNDDLISLRSRGEFSRPFEVVNQIQREAEAQFRDQEQALQAKLKETEGKLQELQRKPEGSGEALLSPEQRKEIELFRGEQLKTRKQLRGVQHDLQKNIERLGMRLKFINIGAIPLLLSVFALGISLYRARRQA